MGDSPREEVMARRQLWILVVAAIAVIVQSAPVAETAWKEGPPEMLAQESSPSDATAGGIGQMVASMIKTMKCEIRACFDEAKCNTQATQILNNFEAKFSSGGEFASLTVVKTAIDCLKDDSKPL